MIETLNSKTKSFPDQSLPKGESPDVIGNLISQGESGYDYNSIHHSEIQSLVEKAFLDFLNENPETDQSKNAFETKELVLDMLKSNWSSSEKPEVYFDDSGTLFLDWDITRDKRFSIAVSKSHTIYFSAMNSTFEMNGKLGDDIKYTEYVYEIFQNILSDA